MRPEQEQEPEPGVAQRFDGLRGVVLTVPGGGRAEGPGRRGGSGFVLVDGIAVRVRSGEAGLAPGEVVELCYERAEPAGATGAIDPGGPADPAESVRLSAFRLGRGPGHPAELRGDEG